MTVPRWDDYNERRTPTACRIMSSPAFLLLFVVGQAAAETAAPAFPPEEIDFFEKRVRPILVRRCYECHSEKAEKVKGELLLDRREAIITGGESGSAATPGEPEKS